MEQFALMFDMYVFGLLIYMLISNPRYDMGATPRKWLERKYLPLLYPMRLIIKPISMGRLVLDASPAFVFILLMLVRTLCRRWASV